MDNFNKFNHRGGGGSEIAPSNDESQSVIIILWKLHIHCTVTHTTCVTKEGQLDNMERQFDGLTICGRISISLSLSLRYERRVHSEAPPGCRFSLHSEDGSGWSTTMCLARRVGRGPWFIL